MRVAGISQSPSSQPPEARQITKGCPTYNDRFQHANSSVLIVLRK